MTNNPYLIGAFQAYQQARRKVQLGMQGNAGAERDRLRKVYRLLAGKPMQ